MNIKIVDTFKDREGFMIGMRHKEKLLGWLAAFCFLTWVSMTKIFTLAHQAFIFLSVHMFYFIIKLPL